MPYAVKRILRTMHCNSIDKSLNVFHGLIPIALSSWYGLLGCIDERAPTSCDKRIRQHRLPLVTQCFILLTEHWKSEISQIADLHPYYQCL